LAQALTAVDGLSAAGEHGFYSGLPGIAWCCTESGALLGYDELVARGRTAMLRAAPIARNPQRLDVINGSASVIPALLHCAEHDQREELLELAIQHGEHLVNMAMRSEQGWSWDTLGMPNKRCHGAPGIGFTRLLLHKLMPNESLILEEAEIAIRTTAATLGEAAPGVGNFSLCHGDGGNADLLVLGAGLLNRPNCAKLLRLPATGRSIASKKQECRGPAESPMRNAQPAAGTCGNRTFLSAALRFSENSDSAAAGGAFLATIHPTYGCSARSPSFASCPSRT
jgi:lantibiotic modifying enzyme